MSTRFCQRFALLALCWGVMICPALSAVAPSTLAPAANFGPYNVSFLEGGIGLARPLSVEAALLGVQAPWSLSGWLLLAHPQSGESIITAIGNVSGAQWRGISLSNGALSLVVGNTVMPSVRVLEAGKWYAVAAVFDGSVAHLYLDGEELNALPAGSLAVSARLELAPTEELAQDRVHFAGQLVQWTLEAQALSAVTVQSRARERPEFSLITFDPVGTGWPWQEHAWRGHEAIKRTPQGWAQSLTPAGENSSAVQAIATALLTPYLTIRVNGVPIAARGGSWGMDDARKDGEPPCTVPNAASDMRGVGIDAAISTRVT
jgi:hypothetical protein